MPLLDNAPNFYAFAQECEIDFILQHGENIIPVEVNEKWRDYECPTIFCG